MYAEDVAAVEIADHCGGDGASQALRRLVAEDLANHRLARSADQDWVFRDFCLEVAEQGIVLGEGFAEAESGIEDELAGVDKGKRSKSFWVGTVMSWSLLCSPESFVRAVPLAD